VSNSTIADGGTVITVPAGRTWQGHLTLAATLAVAIGGAAATRYPKVTVSGAGGNMTDGDSITSLALFVPAVGLTALTGALASQVVSVGPLQVQAGANPIALLLTLGSGVSGSAVAAGEIFG
jgi:hypothetical protein